MLRVHIHASVVVLYFPCESHATIVLFLAWLGGFCLGLAKLLFVPVSFFSRQTFCRDNLFFFFRIKVP